MKFIDFITHSKFSPLSTERFLSENFDKNDNQLLI